jgi:hypothetical protein
VTAHTASALTADEVVFHLPAQLAGELRVAPASWAGKDVDSQQTYEKEFRKQIRALLQLDFDAVLVSHGAVVLERGREALARAVDAPAWGQ